MKLMENYKTGENYAYLGLAPHFLIFDEYVAFMEMLTTKENAAVLNKLKQIVMLGRQAGYFLILACQRPDAKYLGDGIRDQPSIRIVASGGITPVGSSVSTIRLTPVTFAATSRICPISRRWPRRFAVWMKSSISRIRRGETGEAYPADAS